MKMSDSRTLPFAALLTSFSRRRKPTAHSCSILKKLNVQGIFRPFEILIIKSAKKKYN